MAKRRQSIRLMPDEDQFLRTLHRQSGVPDGQFPQRPSFWSRFTATWNEATGRTDTKEEVLHYIMTKRKKGLWFRFDGDHKRMSTPEFNLLTPEQWEVVDGIYAEFGVAADNFLVDSDLRKQILAMFMERTGEYISELTFVAALVARRKGGFLPKTDPGHLPPDGELGFGDIGEVA